MSLKHVFWITSEEKKVILNSRVYLFCYIFYKCPFEAFSYTVHIIEDENKQTLYLFRI